MRDSIASLHCGSGFLPSRQPSFQPALSRLRYWLEQRRIAGRTPVGLGICLGKTSLEALRGLPGVDELDIRTTGFTGKSLRGLGTASDLVEISATCSALDDDALRWAVASPRLARLYMAQTHVTSKGLVALRGKRTLRSLSVSGIGIDHRIAPVLATLKRLEYLAFMETPIDASVCHALAGLPLRELVFRWRPKCPGRAPVLDAKCMQTIGRLSRLEWLVFSSWALRGVDLLPLRRLDKLRYLDLTATAVTHRQLEAISALPALEALQLAKNALDARGLALLRRLPKLRRLSVPRALVPVAKRLLPRVKVEGRWFFWIEGMKAMLRRSRKQPRP